MLRQQLRRSAGYLYRASRKLTGWNETAGAILLYHSTGPQSESGSLPPDLFEEQLSLLSAHYHVISLKELVRCRREGVALPGGSVAITFDDGFADNYTYALPSLLRHGMTATVFVTTRFVDGDIDITLGWRAYNGLPPMTWAQLLEMHSAGICVGAHTASHPSLRRLPHDAARHEIISSKRCLEDHLQAPVTLFAYPRGQPFDFSRGTMQMVSEAGFEAACSTIWGADNRRTNLYALRRLRIDAFDTQKDFEAKLRGEWDFAGVYQTLRGLMLAARRNHI